MSCDITPFAPAEADAVNRLALAAFDQYRDTYDDWPAFSGCIANLAGMARSAELLVARVDGEIAGAVAYVAPGSEKAAFFAPEWPILRMLVVDPAFRGRGIGRALTEACIARARRDGATLIALHTSPVMQVALAMYLRMGFRFEREAGAICGVPYGVYVLALAPAEGA